MTKYANQLTVRRLIHADVSIMACTSKIEVWMHLCRLRIINVETKLY